MIRKVNHSNDELKSGLPTILLHILKHKIIKKTIKDDLIIIPADPRW